MHTFFYYYILTNCIEIFRVTDCFEVCLDLDMKDFFSLLIFFSLDFPWSYSDRCPGNGCVIPCLLPGSLYVPLPKHASNNSWNNSDSY